MGRLLNKIRNLFSTADTQKQKPDEIFSEHEADLLAVIQKLSLAADLETIMFIVRQAARRMMEADGATFVLRDGDQCHYADEDAIGPLWKGKRFPMKMCISGWVMLNSQPAVIEDIYTDERIPIDAYRPTFVKSLSMVPIRTIDPIGAIGVYWARQYRPTKNQLRLLQALADSTSIAIKNIQLYSKIEEGSQETIAQIEMSKKLIETNTNLENTLAELNLRNKEMQYLKELSSTLQTCYYIEEAYKLIAQYAGKLFPHTSGTLYIMHASRNYLESMVSWGKSEKEEKMIKPESCLGLRRGAIYKVKNSQTDLLCEHCKSITSDSSYTCIPLFSQSDILGLFYIEWENADTTAQNIFDQKNDKDILLGMIAEQIGIGISNIKLRETLRHFSFRDTLTGLYNRRYLEETLERELSRCTRKSLPLAIMMIDIDHFKEFNDRFGHEAGDIVIQALSKVLINFTRKEDIACRYGGEEFIFVMPETTIGNAAHRAELLHEALTQVKLRYSDKLLTKVTISIGLAAYPDDAENQHDLINASDVALYEAKNTGRDKTVRYSKAIAHTTEAPSHE
ncbi:MAG TPA: diguanylate cyclase [Gammaproteobacteria bacterium]|jgi:diguanylate cyclase (GGDEF)-like protein|nr:diguanylate cyclase [Gammaproteobacteria bacterium]